MSQNIINFFFQKQTKHTHKKVVVFDLTEAMSVKLELYNSTMLNGRIISGDSPMNLISEITLITGRQKPLPNWINSGGIVGIEGGVQIVETIVDTLVNDYNAPIAGYYHFYVCFCIILY